MILQADPEPSNAIEEHSRGIFLRCSHSYNFLVNFSEMPPNRNSSPVDVLTVISRQGSGFLIAWRIFCNLHFFHDKLMIQKEKQDFVFTLLCRGQDFLAPFEFFVTLFQSKVDLHHHRDRGMFFSFRFHLSTS